MGGASASASSGSSSGIQFGNNQMGDNNGGASKNLPVVILGSVALLLIGGMVWLFSQR